MAMLNPFENDAFNMVSMTTGIMAIPNNYGRIRQLGVFRDEPVRTRTILVERENGVLILLPTQTPGGEETVGRVGNREIRSFIIPHIPLSDVVMPEEVQDVRQFGTESQFETIANVMAKKLRTARNNHGITLEHLRAGALRGDILDADGSTIYNLFTEFGITQKVVDFDLGTAGTDQKAKTIEVKAHIEDNLLGETIDHVRILCSPGFWTKFVAHDTVKAAFDRWQEGRFLRDDMRSGFEFAGVWFEEYRGQASDKDGNTRLFIPAGDARAFPMGTQSTFLTHFSPGDFNETVNTMGQELYARQEPRKMGRGTDIHTQSNPLPLARRPEVLVRCHSST